MANQITGQALDNINHVHTLLSVQSLTPGKLQTASVVTYAADGKTKAKTINADYGNAQFDEKGALSGGSLHFTTHSQGKQLSDSTANLGQDGRLNNISSSIFDRATGGLQSTLGIDFSGVQWTQTGAIQSGQASISNVPAKISSTVTSVKGTITYEAEQVRQMALTHSPNDGTAVVHGYTLLDFANVQFKAGKIAGGHLSIVSQRADKTTSYLSKLAYSPSGYPALLETTGYAVNGTDPTNTTVTDYATVQFDPLGHVVSGSLNLSTFSNAGQLRVKTVVHYLSGTPQTAKSQYFSSQGNLLSQVETDFTGAVFNHHNHVINSTISVRTLRPDGSLLSVAQVSYDEDGRPIKHDITHYRADGKSEASKTVIDYAEAGFNHKRKIVSGRVKSETTAVDNKTKTLKIRHYNGSTQHFMKETIRQNPASQTAIQSIRSMTRPDGTLEELVTQIDQNTASIVRYATDGKTVIKRYNVNYANATVASGAVVSGSVAIDTYDDNKQMIASSNLIYA